MSDEAVTRKARMYALLRAGAFGNANPYWGSVEAWGADPEARRFSSWGVRTAGVPGGPCRLFCPDGEVRATCERPEFRALPLDISPMVEAVRTVTLMADVYDSERGLLVYGIDSPPKGCNWRRDMPSQARQYGPLESRLLLKRHLNASSLADLEAVFDRWPGHVVELSALDRPFGTVPGRNAIIWEVRLY